MKTCVICENEIKKEYFFCYNCKNEIDRIINIFKNEKFDFLSKSILKLSLVLNTNDFIFQNPITLKRIIYSLSVILSDYNNNEQIHPICFDLLKNYRDLNSQFWDAELFSNERGKIVSHKNKEIIKFISKIIELDKTQKNKEFEQESKQENKDFRKKYLPEFRADDGHYVRSQGELLIDNWLYNNHILHEYEQKITLDNEDYYPDFYIKEKNVYIEYFGRENDEQYTEKSNTKINLYNKNNINCIYLYPNDIKHLQEILKEKILNN